MPSSVLAVLKLVFLALLYLFLARVVRAVWVEIFAERRQAAEEVPTGTTPATARTGAKGPAAARSALEPPDVRKVQRRRRAAQNTTASGLRLKIMEPPDKRGTAFDLADEMTVGRAAGCAVCLDDTFASQLHARIFRRDGQIFAEDLGSTNGTFLNRKPVHGPVPFRKNDRLQVGNTVLELAR